MYSGSRINLRSHIYLPFRKKNSSFTQGFQFGCYLFHFLFTKRIQANEKKQREQFQWPGKSLETSGSRE